MKTAVFPGSFYPFTLGHLDVLKSALRLFDKVIVAVGNNSSKNCFFPTEIKLQIIKDCVKGIGNVEVCAYDGMTINYCIERGAKFIVRGLRTTTDFELESVIAQANHKMNSSVQTVFIPSAQEFSFISSTVVRDVLINGGDAKLFLPGDLDIEKYLALRN
mgnify:FL=1